MTANDCQVLAMRTMQRRRSVGTRSQRPEETQMLSTDHIAQALAASGRAQALDAWREAANLVSTRWHLFLAAGGGGRQWASPSYVAALTAEGAAAAALPAIPPP